MPAKHQPKPINHGTVYAYSVRGCRCELCVEVKRATARNTARRRTQLRAAGKAARPRNHGTIYAAEQLGCRCDSCTEAVRRKWRLKSRRKAGVPESGLAIVTVDDLPPMGELRKILAADTCPVCNAGPIAAMGRHLYNHGLRVAAVKERAGLQRTASLQSIATRERMAARPQNARSLAPAFSVRARLTKQKRDRATRWREIGAEEAQRRG